MDEKKVRPATPAKPLIPSKTADEEMKDPSEFAADGSRDAELKRDVPPHYSENYSDAGFCELGRESVL